MPILYGTREHKIFSLYIAVNRLDEENGLDHDKLGVVITGEDFDEHLSYPLTYKSNSSVTIHLHAVIVGIAAIRRHIGSADPRFTHLRVHSVCRDFATFTDTRPTITSLDFPNLSKFVFDAFLHFQSQIGGIEFLLVSEENVAFQPAARLALSDSYLFRGYEYGYYPNMLFVNTVTINGVSVIASNSYTSYRHHQDAMIDASFLWSMGTSAVEATERLKPSFFAVTVRHRCSKGTLVLGCVDLDISVDICGAIKTVQLTEVLVVEDLPVPLHLPSWVFEGESITFNLSNTILCRDRFPVQYHQNLFWERLSVDLGSVSFYRLSVDLGIVSYYE